MQTLTKPRVDRDARREAILDVAQDVFLDEGFAAASMSTIAARLGGSKGTLYNYFKSKEELFNAYVQRRCMWQHDAIYELAARRDGAGRAAHASGAGLPHPRDGRDHPAQFPPDRRGIGTLTGNRPQLLCRRP